MFARGLPSSGRLAKAPWRAWIGGFFGALYVTVAAVAAPCIGAVSLLAAVLAGQTVASVVIDHFGWAVFKEQPVTAGRLAGVLLLAAGVALVRAF